MNKMFKFLEFIDNEIQEKVYHMTGVFVPLKQLTL